MLNCRLLGWTRIIFHVRDGGGGEGGIDEGRGVTTEKKNKKERFPTKETKQRGAPIVEGVLPQVGSHPLSPLFCTG